MTGDDAATPPPAPDAAETGPERFSPVRRARSGSRPSPFGARIAGGTRRAKEAEKARAGKAKLLAEQARRAAAEREAERLTERLRRRDASLREAADRAVSFKAQMEELKRNKEDLLASTSWRVTAPLRLGIGLLRQLRFWAGRVAWWARTPHLTGHRVRHARHLLAQRRAARAANAVRTAGGAAPDADRPQRGRWAEILLRMGAVAEPPCVVVPVYNGVEELELCLRALLRHTPKSARIMVIDDASPDARVAPLLDRFAGAGRVEVFRNAENLGFTRTVNRGIELAGRADVVLLNADTEVTPFWLRNLRLAAYSADKVASATPFSDNAGAFSAPAAGRKNELPTGLSIDDAARLAARAAEGTYPAAPTGNGFCMLLRRDALDAAGPFDAEAFPRGYGEENDWCRRAAKLGWSHVIDDATFIHHVRTVSFGEAKTELMQRGRAVIDERYPDYTGLVRAFELDEAVARARARIGHAFAEARDPVLPRALFVISTRTGGTPQTNEDLMAALQDRFETLLLHCDAHVVELARFRVEAEGRRVQELLERIPLPEALKPFPHRSEEYDNVVRWLLVKYAVELVHVRHIAWHGLGLPALAKNLGVPIVFSFHDFYTVCPNVKLLDERQNFCAGTCTPSPGECAHELWTDRDFPPLKHRSILRWQASMAEMLRHADAFVTTSAGARAQIAKTYPRIAEKPFLLIEHGRDIRFSEAAAPPAADGERIRVLVPGNIGVPKGSLILEGLDRLDAGGFFEFHILGNTNIRQKGGIVFHGPYRREEFAERAAAIRPHFGMILSIWPETYCHTLTELWAATIPVAAFDFGAVGERIRAHGGGWLVAGGSPSARAPDAVLKALRAIAADVPGRQARIDEIGLWQRGPGLAQTTRGMAERYHALYRTLAGGDGGREEGAAGLAGKPG